MSWIQSNGFARPIEPHEETLTCFYYTVCIHTLTQAVCVSRPDCLEGLRVSLSESIFSFCFTFLSCVILIKKLPQREWSQSHHATKNPPRCRERTTCLIQYGIHMKHTEHTVPAVETWRLLVQSLIDWLTEIENFLHLKKQKTKLYVILILFYKWGRPQNRGFWEVLSGLDHFWVQICPQSMVK